MSATIEVAYRVLGPLFGSMSAGIFIVSLLASGLSSSVVGTMAGQVIMQDFVDWRIPLWVRRLMTMLPTIIVAAWATDTTRALVVSQVILSFVLPVPLITLLLFTDQLLRRQRFGHRWHRDRLVDECSASSEISAPSVSQASTQSRMSICASVGDIARPLTGSMSCGQAEKATMQFISARNVTELPGVLTGGRTSTRLPSTTGMFMKRFSGAGGSGQPTRPILR
jgi:Natural resistance-associated macrophage protein-like